MKPPRRLRAARRPLLRQGLSWLLLGAIALQALALAARHGALQGLHLHLDAPSAPLQAEAPRLPLPSLSWPPEPLETAWPEPGPARAEAASGQAPARDPAPDRFHDQVHAHAQAHARGLADHAHDLQQADWLGPDPDGGEDSRSASPAWHPPQAGLGLPAAAPGVALRRGRPPAAAWADWRPAPPQRPPRTRA